MFGEMMWDGIPTKSQKFTNGDCKRLDATGKYVVPNKTQKGCFSLDIWWHLLRTLEGYGAHHQHPTPDTAPQAAVSWYFSSKVSASGKCGMPSGPALKTWRSQGWVMGWLLWVDVKELWWSDDGPFILIYDASSRYSNQTMLNSRGLIDDDI